MQASGCWSPPPPSGSSTELLGRREHLSRHRAPRSVDGTRGCCPDRVPGSGWRGVAGMRVLRRLRRFPFEVKLVYDVLAWSAATASAALLRYPTPSEVPWRHAVLIGAALATVYLVAGSALFLHRGRARTGSLDEISLLTCVAGFSGGVVFVANLATITVARSIPLGATICFIVLAGCGRACWRGAVEARHAVRDPSRSRRTLVGGAGDAGRDLILSMLRDPAGTWTPVGLLDDDRVKRHLRLRGVPVLGDTSEIGTVVAKLDVEVVVVAIPSASADTVSRIATAGRDAGAEVKVLPSTSELLRPHVG